MILNIIGILLLIFIIVPFIIIFVWSLRGLIKNRKHLKNIFKISEKHRTRDVIQITIHSIIYLSMILFILLFLLISSATCEMVGRQEFRSPLRKALSALNQAIALHYAHEGLSAHNYTNSTDLVNNLFKKRMSIIETNSKFTTKDCTGDIFTTADGILFCVQNFSSAQLDTKDSACNPYNTVPCTPNGKQIANIWIDVNGAKRPNKITTSAKEQRDIYQATIYAQKVVPFGEATQDVLFGENNTKVNK